MLSDFAGFGGPSSSVPPGHFEQPGKLARGRSCPLSLYSLNIRELTALAFTSVVYFCFALLRRYNTVRLSALLLW